MSVNPIESNNYQIWYALFNTPLITTDCGTLCAPHNPNQKPFCCDICYAVPFAYHPEWDYLKKNTDLWHIWRGDECTDNPEDPRILSTAISGSTTLLACLGPDLCQRQFRSLSCRQFPFFPYITSKHIFIGLAYNWDFEDTCWMISHLGQLSDNFRVEFVNFYDNFFLSQPQELHHYGKRSAQMRAEFISQKRSITILHRDGGYYLLRPINERLRVVTPDRLPRFGYYREME
jgi:hypothetical protein